MLVKNINFVNYLKEVCWRGHMTTVRQMYEKKFSCFANHCYSLYLNKIIKIDKLFPTINFTGRIFLGRSKFNE